MNRLTEILDWIDNAAGALIRLAYLTAGVTAVAVYFGAGHLPGPVDAALNAGLPWALAFAVETHTYITSRRVRAAWQDMQASTRGSDARERARGALWVNLGVLAVLLAFSAWNQLGYLASSGWTPGGALFALPPAAAYVVRALVVPGAFMAAAFLAPLAEPITAQLEHEARATLADVFRIARKQRKRLLKEAEASGRDMTGALVELVPDPEARRIIAHAYGAIRGEPVTIATALPAPMSAHAAAALQGAGHAMAVDAHPTLTAPISGLAHMLDEPPSKPPTGPGSPVAQPSRASKRARGLGNRPRILRVLPENASAEQRIRALLKAYPAMSVRTLAKRAHVAESTASKWRGIIAAEHATTTAITTEQRGAAAVLAAQ